MSYSIYAMRARGDIEVRYIGQTTKTPETRIAFETSYARKRIKSPHLLRATGFCHWLVEQDVEGVVIASAATKAEACAKEREMVEAFAKLGHRLFNRWLVPPALRIAA